MPNRQTPYLNSQVLPPLKFLAPILDSMDLMSVNTVPDAISQRMMKLLVNWQSRNYSNRPGAEAMRIYAQEGLPVYLPMVHGLAAPHKDQEPCPQDGSDGISPPDPSPSHVSRSSSQFTSPRFSHLTQSTTNFQLNRTSPLNPYMSSEDGRSPVSTTSGGVSGSSLQQQAGQHPFSGEGIVPRPNRTASRVSRFVEEDIRDDGGSDIEPLRARQDTFLLISYNLLESLVGRAQRSNNYNAASNVNTLSYDPIRHLL